VYGIISNCYSIGFMKEKDFVAGFIGYNLLGRIFNCYSRELVNGRDFVGGLIGYKAYGRVEILFGILKNLD
jgi:hypothetical protein